MTGGALLSAGVPVYWDGYGFTEGHSGISRYASSLGAALEGLGLRPELLKSDGSGGGQLVSRMPANKLLWPAWSFASALKRAGNKQKVIFHGLANINLPLLAKKPRNWRFVLTLHDLIPLLPESGVSWSLKSQFAFALPRVLQVADAIVCVSDWTRQTLLERFPAVEGRSLVIQNGPGYLGRGLPAVDEGKGDGQQVVAVVGTVSRLEGYKRLSLIPQILEGLPEYYRWKLVTCARGRQYFQRRHAQLLRSGRLALEHCPDDQSLEGFYRSLRCYVHPSLYEGFGLPVWEALNFQRPVVFQGGHALDMLRGHRACIAIPGRADPQLWAESVLRICEGQEYPESVMPDSRAWPDSARALMTVYNSLD